MKDGIAIWENGTKKRDKKYYLTMFHHKLLVSDKVKFSTFWDLLSKKFIATETFPCGSM